MNFLSHNNYDEALNEIVTLTNKPSIVKVPMVSNPLTNSVGINFAIDLIIKYTAYFINPFASCSQDTTITKDGTVLRIVRDPLEYIINTSKGREFDTKEINDPSKFLESKFYWIHFLSNNIINHILSKQANKINLECLEHLLIELFRCSGDTRLIAEDLYKIITNMSFDFLKNRHSVINPSFNHVFIKEKNFATQADLIVNDMLVDIKNTKHLLFTKEYYKQILYYYFWTTLDFDEGLYRFNIEGRFRVNHLKSDITTLAIFYPRYNYLLKFPIKSIWKNRNSYKHAKEIFFNAITEKYS